MKEKLTIVGLALLAGVLGIAFLVLSSVKDTDSVGTITAVPFITLTSGTQSSVTRRANYAINSEDQLRQLWRMIETNDSLPTVDFTDKIVIAVFAGTKPTAGYSISVSRIEDSGISRTVKISLTEPGVTCILAQAETTPFQIIEVPRSSLALTHADAVSTISCLN